MKKKALKEAQDYVTMTMNVITNDDAYLGLLSLLSNHSEQIYAHSLAVSIFSVMIAKNIGYESNLALNKISLAAFFHDIGKKELSPALLVKPRHMMSSHERVEYESHAVRGRDIMSSIKGTPDEVVQIVYEHHEDPTGQGYPFGKAKKVIHPLARIVHCANIFVENALVSPTNKGMPGRDAVLYIEKIYGDQLDMASLEGLKAIYKID